MPVLVTLCLLCVGQTFIKVEASHGEKNKSNISTVGTSIVERDGSVPYPSRVVAHSDGIGLNDSDCERQWALQAMKLPIDSDLYQNPGNQVQVAVLDSGIDSSHEDLQGKVVMEINLTDSPYVTDINGHGTHIAGIIAANSNNGLGIAGIAPFSQLINIKVADDSGKVYAKTLAEGIVRAVQNGADVINASIEIQEPIPELENAVNYAWGKGVLVVAAASNHSVNPVYPACFSNCLAVAAIDQLGKIGPLPHTKDYKYVAAPGDSIYSTRPNNQYGYMSGSSCATAHLSGLAALLFSIAVDANGNGKINDDVRAAIEAAASDVAGSDIKLINAASALNRIINIRRPGSLSR